MEHHFSKHRSIFRIILVGIVILLAVLTFFAKQTPYFPFDLTVTKAIQAFNVSWFDSLMRFLSFIGNPIPGSVILIVLTTFLLIFRRYKENSFLLISAIGGYILSEIFKVYVGRPRPDPNLIYQLDHFIRQDSFPSGHVLYFINFYGFLLFLIFTHMSKSSYRNVLIIFFSVLIILIGPSRIYIGAHWFSDVLGAYLLGILWLSLIVSLYNHLQRKNAKIKF